MPLRRSRDVDIKPGQEFHLPAAQEKNIDNLLKIFGKKEATEALTEMAKTKASTWTDIKDSITGLNDFVAVGGATTIIAGFKETVDLQIADALSPLTNTINQLLIDALAPVLEKLTTIINDLAAFILRFPTGAVVGGVVGGIASLFLPGGVIVGSLLVAIGAVVGAAIENFFNLEGNLLPSWTEEQWAAAEAIWGPSPQNPFRVPVEDPRRERRFIFESF